MGSVFLLGLVVGVEGEFFKEFPSGSGSDFFLMDQHPDGCAEAIGSWTDSVNDESVQLPFCYPPASDLPEPGAHLSFGRRCISQLNMIETQGYVST